jgi:hypothetical protein
MAGVLGRQQFRIRPGLRAIMLGLLVSSVAGLAISQTSVLIIARLWSILVLGGMGVVVWGIHREKALMGASTNSVRGRNYGPNELGRE